MKQKIMLTLNPRDGNFRNNIDELDAADVYPKVYVVHTAHGKIITARYFRHVEDKDNTYEFEHRIKPADAIENVYVFLTITS